MATSVRIVERELLSAHCSVRRVERVIASSQQNMLIVLVLSFILHDSRVLSALTFEISAVYLADTEKYVPYSPPIHERIWSYYKENAEYLGFLFAGKSEFSWVVDLRVIGTDQELWSTGNLYSSNWVMTTCQAKHYLEEALRGLGPKDKRTADVAKVTYFQLYFWEYMEETQHGTFPTGGVRNVEQYFVHPFCDQKRLEYDLAMLKLKDGISPVAPYIGYMPLKKDPYDEKTFRDLDFSRIDAQKRVCYVGSVGRNYANWRKHLVLDFKVSFRVYYEFLNNCTTLADRLCDSTRHDCSTAFSSSGFPGREWECMRTRAWVGTVCDHDRGAPVVCDGEVVGIVAYGALFENCNNRIPMPFVVIKLHLYSAWTQSIVTEKNLKIFQN